MKKQVSQGEVEFFAEPPKGRIRINDRRPGSPPRESHWVKTPECLLRFSTFELEGDIEGFPHVECLPPKTRVLRREPAKTEDGIGQGYFSPLAFFNGGESAPCWRTCSSWAGTLRGDKGTDLQQHAENNLVLVERRKGEVTQYVATERYKTSEIDFVTELVFSSDVDYNIVSRTFLRRKEQTVYAKQYEFRNEKDIFIPFKVEEKNIEGDETTYTLTKTELNGPIDPAVFEVSSMGLSEGDRMADWIEHRMSVFDGKQFVPADKFKLQPAK